MQPSAGPSVEQALAGWLPAGVVCLHRPVAMPAEAETTAHERAHVQKAVTKRQREFLTGRVAARAALAQLGLPCAELPAAPDRSPQWPAEVVGSIAHSATECIVGVAQRRTLRALGLDTEPARPLEAELWPRIATAREREWLARQAEAERGLWVRHLFCAKEAVYKGQHPEFRLPLGFQDLEIHFSPSARRYQVSLSEGADPAGLAEAGRGRFADYLAHAEGSWRDFRKSLFYCALWTAG